MALLLETTLGDLVIDLDVEGSPALCQNILQLAEARYYTQTLIYNIQANRFCQLGDPHGDGTGGACYQGVLDTTKGGKDVTQSTKRFLKSQGRRLTSLECQEKGRVVATEMKGIPDTIGSQFLITLAEGPGMALDAYTADEGDGNNNNNNGDSSSSSFLSLGRVTEDDDNVLQQLASLYCDSEGRPFVDVRVKRALVIHNPFLEDNSQQPPSELKDLMARRGVKWEEEEDKITRSPDYERPPEERVKPRITADQVELVDDEDEEALQKLQQLQDEEAKKHDAKSRAVVLEMLGDLPDADIKAPENVLFVCKLNPVTEDEDLELIFSRFDNNVKAEIIRDQDTGTSLQYAFVEFTKNKQAEEAYFKMNNALVDDRRIKVDFSQSVAKMWDRFNQKLRPTALKPEDIGGGRGGGGRGGRGGGGRGRGGWDGRGRGGRAQGGRDFPQGGRGRSFQDDNRRPSHSSNNHRQDHHQSSGHRHQSGQHNGNGNSRGGHGRSFDDNRGRGPPDRDRSYHRPNVDEFGRAVATNQPSNGDNHRRERRVSPPDDRRSGHSHRRRSPSRSDSRSPSPDHRRRRSSSREHDRKSRKHHKSSRKHKKKDHRKHHDRDDRQYRRREDSDDDSRANDSKRRSQRRYDSDDEPGESTRKRRYESDASDEHHKSKKKHSKHHKKEHRRKRSRSR